MMHSKHILIFRLSAMGDVAMTVPVIRALIDQHPEVRVTVVSRPFFKPFFQDIERVDFFAIDVKDRHKGMMGLWRLYCDLQKLNVDYFADFHNVLRSKFVRTLFKLKGTKVASIDKGRAAKQALTRATNKIFKQVPTMFSNHLGTLSKLGFKVDLSKPKFPQVPVLKEEFLQYFDPSSNLIGIAPFAQYEGKVYPLDLMQQIVNTLAENPKNTILLFGGGEKEIALLNQLKQGNSNVVIIAGEVKFDAELNLIQNLDVMLSMDSGNAHIAAMLGKKVVTLWGATHPFAGFAPFNQPVNYCLTSDRTKYPLLPTSVYGNKVIDGYEDAMRTIDPQEVCNKLMELINRDK